MSTNYMNSMIKPNRINDGFSDCLREASEYFSDKGLKITNATDMSTIMSEDSMFEKYKNFLTEGLNSGASEEMADLFDNTRMEMLRESTVSGVQQISGLVMPTIRKMWAKVALKHAIPTEVAKTPRFSISYTKSYLIDSNGKKHFIPDELDDINNTLAQLPVVQLADGTFAAPGSYNLRPAVSAGIEDVTNEDGNLTYKKPVPVMTPFDTFDKKFTITVVKTNKGDVTVNRQTDLYGNLVFDVLDPDDKSKVLDTVFAKFDAAEGKFSFTSLNSAVTGVQFKVRVSHENNNFGESVGFDIVTKEVQIGVGTHLNAPLQVEWLQDLMALYNIDGASEIVDLMSQTTAQKLEIEIYNFLVQSFENTKNFASRHYHGVFDLRPSAGFAGRPKEWREELKTVIDHFAIRMKSDMKFHSGEFVIIGNPIDTALIPNVDWIFNHNDNQVGGVDVNYSIGAYSGANKYRVVASDLIPREDRYTYDRENTKYTDKAPDHFDDCGALYMIFIPAMDRLMTYKYYPYTFNIEKTYRDPNTPNVPSIMVTKRHTIEEFTPMIAKIDIRHNDGTIPTTDGY